MGKGMLLCPRLERRSKRVGHYTCPPSWAQGGFWASWDEGVGRTRAEGAVSWHPPWDAGHTALVRDQADSVGHEASLADWPPLFPVLLLQVRAAGAAQASSVSGTQAAEGGRAGSCWGQARTMEPTAFQGAVVDASVRLQEEKRCFICICGQRASLLRQSGLFKWLSMNSCPHLSLLSSGNGCEGR